MRAFGVRVACRVAELRTGFTWPSVIDGPLPSGQSVRVVRLDPVTEHQRSIRHRADVLAANEVGCFSCLATYPPSEVVDWADADAEKLGQTAICPRCFVDAVIPVRPGVDHEFLAAMNRHWFG